MVSPVKSPSSSKKLPDRRRHSTTSSGSQLPMTSFIGVTTTSTSILDLVTGTPQSRNNSPATIADLLGRTADAAGACFVQELRPPGTAKGNTDWYKECTESLGYESLAEKKDISNNAEVIDDDESSSSSRSKMMRVSGVSRKKMNFNDFPPLISTLDSSGRPRFSYEKLTGSDGRLSINMVESDRPDLVHYTTIGDDGESMVRRTVVRCDKKSDYHGKTNEEMTDDAEKNKEEITVVSEDNDGEKKKKKKKKNKT